MQTFLNIVADDLLRRFPDGMQNLDVVFPGKRARLFLYEYTTQHINRPYWSPTAHTMQELFLALSPYTIIDDIEAICLLYKAYQEYIPTANEPLDEFFGWGQVLLSDFNDVDKQLVDAHALFANIEDLERLTSDHFLEPEQETTLQHFFSSFSIESNSQLRERFMEMWHAMPMIYDAFHDAMCECGRMTEGALMRDVIMRLRDGRLQLPSDKTYAFIGLNALSKAEKVLMHSLKAEGQTLFYWDYDLSFLDDKHEAGTFMRQNLTEFPNAMPGSCFNNIHEGNDKRFTYVAAAGQNVQARYIPTWIKDLKASNQTSTDPQSFAISAVPDTAIVLCDEKLLQPVLHAIPHAENGGPATANITMGFPMSSTPIYNLLHGLMNMHTDGWDARQQRFRTYERHLVELNPLICEDIQSGKLHVDVHSEGSPWLVKYLIGIVEYVAAREKDKYGSDTGSDAALQTESIYRAYCILTRIDILVNNGTLQVQPPCLCGIINQALSAITIPFHGEPIEGLQVMGLLETRCLDFRNILMLSVGEGYVPQQSPQTSFIPYSLRMPFGLTTMEQRVGINAYYFYRLIERAEDITFVYDTSTSGGCKGEMSRFLRQLLAEMRPGGQFPDRALVLKPSVSLPNASHISAKTTPAVIAKLKAMESFSPSALEKYISCPLSYYLRYVGGIKEYQEDSDDMDAATFGEIFHASAEDIYTAMKGKQLTHDFFNHYIGEANKQQGRRELQDIVERNLDKYYFQQRKMKREDGMTGAIIIRRDVIVQYLVNLLKYDRSTLDNEERWVVDCEARCKTEVTLSDGTNIVIGGIIDRIDRIVTKDGTERLQIIDYKTMSKGNSSERNKDTDLALLFAPEAKFQSHIFQTFIYALTQLDNPDVALPVQPTVFYTQDAAHADYSSVIMFNKESLTDVTPYANEFRNKLKELIEGILDPNVDFLQTTNNKNCDYCPFKDICRILPSSATCTATPSPQDTPTTR